ncbi:MAG: (Fe-S)-binding protein [Desulfurococcales archaeon]|nr:(Fe-S)-binding protein [Desulfurococcales archaeon]
MALVAEEKGSSSKDRVEKAVKEIVRLYVGMPELHFLDSCVDCGVCAASCPWANAVSELLYAPHEKANKLRRMYRKTSTLSGKLLGPLVGAGIPGEEELDEIMDAAYHCSNCGWCFYTCPHGVDSGAVIALLRGVLYRIGKTPTVLSMISETEKRILLKGEIPPTTMRIWTEKISELGERHEALPLGESKNLVLLTVYDIVVMPEVVDAYLTLLDAAGIKYSLPDTPLGVKPPFPFVIGDFEGAKQVAESIFNYAVSHGANTLIVLDGGYPYNDLKYLYRFYRAEKPKGLTVEHVLRILYDTYDSLGLPPLVRWGRAAYIPSGHIDTRGGIGDGAKLVEATAEKYDKHLLWPYGGLGNVSLSCPAILNPLGEALEVDLARKSDVERRLEEHAKLVGLELAKQAAQTGPGYHVFSSMDDVKALEHVNYEGVRPIHIAVWLAKHLK